MQLVAFILICSLIPLSTGESGILPLRCGNRKTKYVDKIDERFGIVPLSNKGWEIDKYATTEGDWPWIAAIYHSVHNTMTFKCVGTLIHPSIVLTSAQCVLEEGRHIAAHRIAVHLGRYSLKETGTNVQIFQVHELFVHPDFTASNLEKNIAIIHLSSVATFNDYVQPVCLPNSDRLMNTTGTVIGWGIVQGPTLDISETPQKVVISMTESINCLDGSVETFLPDGHYCASPQDVTTSIIADRGASITFQENGVYSVRGISSKIVIKHGCNNEYMIFTDVAKFIPWIQETVLPLNRSRPANVTAPSIKRAVACEGSNLDITCQPGEKIYVMNANYGRTSLSACSGSLIPTDNCLSKNSSALVAYRCSNKQQCTIKAQNDVFGDPCLLIPKYLEVDYICSRDVSAPSTKIAVACEGSNLDITCQPGEKIYVMNANYGRKSSSVCSGAWPHNINCIGGGSSAVVGERCSNKQRCTIPAQNDVFGDPCRGTAKYLEVDYICTQG